MTNKDNAEISSLEITWEYNMTYGDWTLHIPLPQGYIRGAVTYTDANSKNLTVWGTVEVKSANQFTINSQRYDYPAIGIDAISRHIMSAMVNIITDLANLKLGP